MPGAVSPRHVTEVVPFGAATLLGGPVGASVEGKAPPPQPFLPFSLGARNCIGMHLAQTELKAALAHIVARYELAPVPEDPVAGVHDPRVMLLMTLCPSRTWLRVVMGRQRHMRLAPTPTPSPPPPATLHCMPRI